MAENLFIEPSAVPQSAIAVPVSPFARAQLLRLNSSLVSRLQGAATALPARLLINLFSDERHAALIERRDVIGVDRVICQGRLEKWPGSQILLAFNHGALAGSVFIPGRGSFQIQHVGSGWQRVGQLDQQQVPPCGVKPASPSLSAKVATLLNKAQPTALATANSSSSPASNMVIDLLVVYTPAARDGAGGTDGINALIDVAVAEANNAYQNSQVDARLRLVQTAEVAYEESDDINQDLDNLEQGDSGDGPISDVRQLRAQYQADLVCMITETTGGPLGLANQMQTLDVSFGAHAFSVVQRQFANTYYVLAHELGHNMGCQHDRDYSSSDGVYSFSHAYRFVLSNITYHTVMAPQPGLPIPHFSNPDVSFMGVPTGVDEGLPNSANNAKSINLTVATVANFSSMLPTVQPPRIVLLDPVDGASFIVPAVVELNVDAEDQDGQVVRVEFSVNGVPLGNVQSSPFTLFWTNTTAGTFSIIAQATDDDGWKSASAVATVTFALAPPVFDAAASSRLGDGSFRLSATGADGQGFRIDASADLQNWSPILTNRFAHGPFEFVDLDAISYQRRFYRIISWP